MPKKKPDTAKQTKKKKVATAKQTKGYHYMPNGKLMKDSDKY